MDILILIYQKEFQITIPKRKTKILSNIENVNEVDGKVIINSKTTIDASELNKYLAENNIYLTHLVKRNHSLEEQFLELTGK